MKFFTVSALLLPALVLIAGCAARAVLPGPPPGAEPVLDASSVKATFTGVPIIGDYDKLRDLDFVLRADSAGRVYKVRVHEGSHISNRGLLLQISTWINEIEDNELVRAAVTQRTKLIYIETPCNPIMRLTDIAAVAEIAREAGAKLAADNTFSTPVATRPLELGADYVVHSLTKYLCGHGDAIGGALLGPAAEIADLRKSIAIRTGGVISPFNAWLIMRGIATLPIRLAAHQAGALEVAGALENHPKVSGVMYPGLKSHPQHGLAAKQMENFSGMLTFQVDDGPRAAQVLAERLEVIHYAVSLGHHRSLIYYLPTDEMLTTSFRLEGAQRESYRAFSGEGIFRLSVGIEDAADLIADLERALARV